MNAYINKDFGNVAPFTGAWIEILSLRDTGLNMLVAPFTGAWIEIHPRPWEAGETKVAPFTGAWIEIVVGKFGTVPRKCRSLHGSVD